MASRSSCRWLHVLYLVALQHTWISASEPAPTRTHWGNFTTGSDQVYVTNEGTTKTLSTPAETYRVNATTGLDFYITNNETSRTPDITLEASRPDKDVTTSNETQDTPPEIPTSNVTEVLHWPRVSQDTPGTPSSTVQSLLNDPPTGPDLSYVTAETTRAPNTTQPENVTSGSPLTYVTEETSGIPNSTPEKYPNNVTTGPELGYITEETSRAPNSTLENYPNNVTTGPEVTYTTQYSSGTSTSTLDAHRNNATTRPDIDYLSEETSRTPNNTLQSHSSNITSAQDLISSSEEASRTPSTTTEKYPSNVTSESHLTYITEEPSRTPNTTYPSNVTTAEDLTYITEEPSRTSNTTYPSNVTTAEDLTYITEEPSRTPNTIYPSNVTTAEDLTYITEEPYRTSNTTYPSNVTTAEGLTYITEEPSRTSNNILESFSNGTSGSDLTYLIGETVRTPNSTLQQFQSNVTTDPGLVYPSETTTVAPNTSLEMGRTSYPDGISPFDPMDPITEAPAVRTTNASLQTGASSIGAVRCVQDADCPPLTVCSGQGALHMCHCHLGHFFHPDLGCVAARAFPARIPLSVLFWGETLVDTSVRGYIGDEIGHMEAALYYQGIHKVRILFQDVLNQVPGYVSTSVIDVQLDEGLVTIIHSFSMLYAVTEEDVWGALMASPLFCDDPHDGCASPLTSDNYQGLSLCDFDVCDSTSSDCRSHGGLVTCECRQGYYKFSPTDRSCGECGSGYRRTESGCERCPIGFGGFNCDESYLLAVIVESCVGCGLLVSLITLLVFYFRRKEPQKPMFVDSIVLGVPTNQPSLRLPRAQFSWRREWEWHEPPEKVQTDIHQEEASPDGPAVIHMKTFGDPARFSAPSSYHGRHNLSFISD